jgi:hypothetical protein
VVGRVAGVETVSVSEGCLAVEAREDLGATINRSLADAGLYASQLVRKRGSLEDLFLELTAEPAENAEPQMDTVTG